MKIRNSLYAWLYFLPVFLFFILVMFFDKKTFIFGVILFLFFSSISFIDTKLFQAIRRFLLSIFIVISFFACMPQMWYTHEGVSILIVPFLLVIIIIMQTISEYQWHKKINKNKWIISFVMLYLFFCVYQYIENKKADSFAMYICEKSINYKNIDELNSILEKEDIINKLFTKKPSTEQFGDSILFHRYTIRRPWGFFDNALISCKIKTDMQGNILSHEIK